MKSTQLSYVCELLDDHQYHCKAHLPPTSQDEASVLGMVTLKSTM